MIRRQPGIAAAPRLSRIGGTLKRHAAPALLLASLLCAAPSPSSAASPATPASPATSTAKPSQRPAPAPRLHLGVNAWERLTEPELRRLAGHGLRLYRTDIRWDEAQPAPGEWDWSRSDRLMLDAARAGVRVQPVLAYAPHWVTGAPTPASLGGQPWAPVSSAARAGYADFARRAVSRYRVGGAFWAEHPELTAQMAADSAPSTWEVWNEPNLRAFWYPRPDPRSYARLLAAAAPAIRSADPTARVLLGGLAFSRYGREPQRYLRSVARVAPAGSFDDVSIHPYSSTPGLLVAHVRETRRTLDTLGSGRRRGQRAAAAAAAGIAVTEFGWAVGAPTGRPGAPTAGSEAEQARFTGNALRSLHRQQRALRLRTLIWFSWRDVTPNPGDRDFWGYHTGLLRLDGSERPAWAAYRLR